MKIKLKDKDNPITQLWCFMYRGYDSSLIEQINSGKQDQQKVLAIVYQQKPKILQLLYSKQQ